MALATAAMAAAMGLTALWLGPVSAPAPRSPFGMGIREAAPSGNLGAWILSVQSGFYASLQASVRALKESGAAWGSLLFVGFAYGVFHAAGPGHGKSVISAYLVADEKALRKALLAVPGVGKGQPTDADFQKVGEMVLGATKKSVAEGEFKGVELTFMGLNNQNLHNVLYRGFLKAWEDYTGAKFS